jgi:hypothetical protein
MLQVFRYETPQEVIKNFKGPVIFLAGPTVRGNQYDKLGPSWRLEAISFLEKEGFDGSVVVPEFTDPHESDKGRRELPLWEHNGLTRADCILFWIPRTREQWGLNTNSEHGFWLAKDPDKLVYGRPDGAYRIDYNDIMHDRIYHERGEVREIWKTLGDVCRAAIPQAQKRWTLNNEDFRLMGYFH